eukprot:UN10467
MSKSELLGTEFEEILSEASVNKHNQTMNKLDNITEIKIRQKQNNSTTSPNVNRNNNNRTKHIINTVRLTI